jgi:hypothetical protein
MKICRIIFSTNRLEFLIPTLESHKINVDMGNHEVHSILIDDYPKDRDDYVIKKIADAYGINDVVLHKENIGITETWNEAWDIVKDIDCDYIWHHEDDVHFKQKVNIDVLWSLLNDNKEKYCQVVLKRNPWYDFEYSWPLFYDTDFSHDEYLAQVHDEWFWSLASLYPKWVTSLPIREAMNTNLCEGSIMKYIREKLDMKAIILKNKDGSNVVEHIGLYFKGIRASKIDPHWKTFNYMDPDVKYDSRTGSIWQQPENWKQIEEQIQKVLTDLDIKIA